jgi:histidinol dehydrogenase
LKEALHNALFMRVDTLDQACELCDLAAAEHVEIWSRDALALSTRIKHAGAIFLNTPVPLGDYIAGPSHTLPTGATARYAHGVGVETFLKRTSVVSASRGAIQSLCEDLSVLANLEELPGHANAVQRASEAREDHEE